MPDWSAGRWTRQPAGCRLTDDGLQVEAEQGSDFWRHTLYAFQHDDGHALLAPFSDQRAVEVTFDAGSLVEQYDQAGLMLWAAADQWIKAGVEISDGAPQLSCVATHGVSDWSVAPVPSWRGLVTVRLSCLGGAAILRARTPGEGWRMLRVTPLFGPQPMRAGPMVCAPSRAGLRVTFRRWDETAPDRELHADP